MKHNSFKTVINICGKQGEDFCAKTGKNEIVAKTEKPPPKKGESRAGRFMEFRKVKIQKRFRRGAFAVIF